MREADIPILTPLELANVGRVLYGAHWREGLVTALGLPDDALICAVEAGIVEAPGTWRARLIAEAQNVALRAMDAANTLLWGDHEGASPAEGELV